MKTQTHRPPKGFSDIEARRKLGAQLRLNIDAYEASLQNPDADSIQLPTLDRWKRTQRVYDEAVVLSSLTFLKDIVPYSMPLMVPRVNGIVSDVCGNLASASPYFILRAPGQDEHLEDAEATLHYALQQAYFERKVRDAGYMAGLRGRGMLRIRYETMSSALLSGEDEVMTMADDSAADPQGLETFEGQVPAGGEGPDGDLADPPGSMPIDEVFEPEAPPKEEDKAQVRYSGLVIDAFKPENCIVYPSFVENISDAMMVGHAFFQRAEDIDQKRQFGRYFKDSVTGLTQDAPEAVVVDAKDYAIKCYDLLCKLNEPGKPEKRYRVTIQYSNSEVLDIEEYELPTPWYFAPAFIYEIDQFWPSRSIADRMIEIQTIYNDAVTEIILGTAASAWTNVAVSGATGQQQSATAGMCSFMFFRGNPTFTPIPSKFEPGGLEFLMQKCESGADLVSRYSQLQQGQSLPAGATATEAEALSQGQQAGISEYGDNFAQELCRMADLGRFLLALNFQAFSDFHGAAVTCQASDLRGRLLIEANGKSAAQTSQAIVSKITALSQLAQALGIPVMPSAEGVSGAELFKAGMASMDLSVSTAKVMQPYTPPPMMPEQSNGPIPQAPGQAQAAPSPSIPGQVPPSGIPPGGPSGGLDSLPPELLQVLLQAIEGQLAAYQMASGAGGALPGTGVALAPGGLPGG